MRVARKTSCRLCGSADLATVIPLSALPIASPNVGGGARPPDTAPADLQQCRCCGFLQLVTVVDPELQYRDFRYTTGLSLGLRAHFERLVETLAQAGEIAPGTFVLDIGSNDGSLLRFAEARGARVLGVDPAAAIAQAASASGIPTLADFFTEDLGQAIARDHGRAGVVVSANTVANIDDLEDFFAGVRAVIAPRGLLVIETQYALDVLRHTLLDVIYHEHLSYFSVRPLRAFLGRAGFELVDAERIAPKGGSLRLFIQPEGAGRPVSPRVARMVAEEDSLGLYDADGFARFNEAIAAIGAELRARLAESRRRTGRALAYGASVGCAALIHHLGLGESVDALYDDSPLVDHIPSGGRRIPVLPGARLQDEAATDVPVLAWRYAREIARKQAAYGAAGGRFYTVLPRLEYIRP